MILEAEARPHIAEFPVVTKILNAIKAQPLKDSALGEMAANYIVKSMAEENGFTAFHTPEERELAAALRQMTCGPRAAYYAWRLYRRYRESGDISADAISY